MNITRFARILKAVIVEVLWNVSTLNIGMMECAANTADLSSSSYQEAGVRRIRGS
jgi:hypothetical protein